MSILEEQEFSLDTEKMASNSRHMRKEQLTWSLMIYAMVGGKEGRPSSSFNISLSTDGKNVDGIASCKWSVEEGKQC